MALGSGTDSDANTYDVSYNSLSDWIADVLDYGYDPNGTSAYLTGTAIGSSGPSPYNGPHNIPGTIQSEDYDQGGEGTGYHINAGTGGQSGYRTDNNGNIHTGAGPGGNGWAVGWSNGGEWYKYTVNVQTAGTYTVSFQCASAGGAGTFHLEDETGTNLTGSVAAPNTGSWSTWQTVNANATLSAGTHTLKLVEDANGPNPWVADFDDITFAAQSSGPNTSFATSFESGQIQPTWTNTPDNDFWNSVNNPANITGFISGVGPECGVRSNGDYGINANTGSQMLMVAGTANGGGSTFCYFKVFDLSANPVVIQSSSTISYWINPIEDNGRYIAVDFHCTDGTTLRDSGIRDGNGNGVHPNAGHGGSIPLSTWTQISAGLGSLTGKKIDRIWVAYDRPGSTGQLRAYIDDLNIDPPAGNSAPAAPSGISAIAGNGQVNVSWSAPAGVITAYNIYRSTTAGGEGTTPYKSAITGTSYQDSGLTNGTTYFYKVAALNGTLVGAFSSETSALPVAPPAVPTGFTATAGATGSKTISLKWTAVPYAASYTLYRSTTSGGTYSQLGTTTATGYSNTGLTVGTTYYYKVSATNVSGTSAQSASANAKAR
jgi:hypothetical protein